MFPATFRWGKSARLWNTIPMSRVWAGRSVMSWSPRKTRPAVGFSSPATIRSIVVFPQPDGPRNEMSLPGGSSRSTPSTAATWSNRLTSPSSRRPPRAFTASDPRSGDDQLGPVLVDPVLQLVVDLVLRPERGLRPGSGHDLVLLVAHREGLSLRGRDRAEGQRQLLLDLRLAHPIDERHAGADVLRRLRDRPEAGVEDRALGREHAAQRRAAAGLRRREHRDVVVELAERHLALVVLRLRLRLVPEPQLHVRLDLGQLVHHLQDPVLGLEDLVAVEERLGG